MRFGGPIPRRRSTPSSAGWRRRRCPARSGHASPARRRPLPRRGRRPPGRDLSVPYSPVRLIAAEAGDPGPMYDSSECRLQPSFERPTCQISVIGRRPALRPSSRPVLRQRRAQLRPVRPLLVAGGGYGDLHQRSGRSKTGAVPGGSKTQPSRQPHPGHRHHLRPGDAARWRRAAHRRPRQRPAVDLSRATATVRRRQPRLRACSGPVHRLHQRPGTPAEGAKSASTPSPVPVGDSLDRHSVEPSPGTPPRSTRIRPESTKGNQSNEARTTCAPGRRVAGHHPARRGLRRQRRRGAGSDPIPSRPARTSRPPIRPEVRFAAGGATIEVPDTVPSGFVDIRVEVLEGEGGARLPVRPDQRRRHRTAARAALASPGDEFFELVDGSAATAPSPPATRAC